MSASNPTGKWPLQNVLFVSGFGLLAGFALLQILLYPFGTDQAIFYTIGDVILRGGRPYVDAWDIKPPAIYYLYALAQFFLGRHEFAIRFFEFAALLTLFPAFTYLSRRAFNSSFAGILSAAIACFLYARLGSWHTAQAEGFGAIAMIWAMALAEHGRSSPKPLRWLFASGFFYGISALFKPTITLAFPATLAVVVAQDLHDRNFRKVLSSCITLALGILLPVAVCAAYLASVGALLEGYHVVYDWTTQYTRIGDDTGYPFSPLLSSFLRQIWIWNIVPILAALFLPWRNRNDRWILGHFAAATVLLLIGVLIQKKLFMYHFAPVVLTASIFIGFGYWNLWLQICRVPQLAFRTAIASLVLAPLFIIERLEDSTQGFWVEAKIQTLALLQGKPVADNLRYASGSTWRNSAQETADFVRQKTPPLSPLYIWGMEPLLYYLAQRPPASRYIQNQPIRTKWSRRSAEKQLLADLKHRPPSAIVIASNDHLQWITGNDLDSSQTLKLVPLFSSYLHNYYHAARKFDNLEVWLPGKSASILPAQQNR